MKRPAWGLQSKFIGAIALMLAIVVLVMVLLWNRQQASRHEVSEATRESMRVLLADRMRQDGEAEIARSLIPPDFARYLNSNPQYALIHDGHVPEYHR